MRWNGCPITIAFAAALLGGAAPLHAATFGSVVPIGGHASDIALDETRGALYIANFTANRIEVMSTADRSIRTSMNVAAQPGAIAVSPGPDRRHLLIAHYGNWADSDPMRNLITLIDLTTGQRQTFVTGDAPLGVAFVRDGYSTPSQNKYQALIVTTTSFVLLDPVSGAMRVLATFADLISQTLPQPQATFPPKILQTAVAVSGDGYVVWGIGDAGTGAQMIFCYDVRLGNVNVLAASSSPALLPRVSVNQDGTRAMIGYAVFCAEPRRIQGNAVGPRFLNGVVAAQYPDVLPSENVTGSAFDGANGTIYAQIPDASQPIGPPYSSGTSPATQASTASMPALTIMDADNLTVRERLGMPENMVGRAVLSADGKILYAISDSGVMVLPVGSLDQYSRVAASQEDLVVQSNFCDRRIITRSLSITAPGGVPTDFSISVNQPGVTVSPTSGIAPATVQVRVDPNVFANRNGATVISLEISSQNAVNVPRPVRLVVSNPSPDQRGTVIAVPGRLSDMLADPQRNRIYVLRQERNQLLVYDGGNYTLVKTLRTATTPTRMAFTIDRRYLVVGHDNAQTASVFDLDLLEPAEPILLPFGQYARSLAESNADMLAVVRNASAASVSGGASAWIGASTGPAAIDRVDWNARTAMQLPTLGIWNNAVSHDAALAAAPNGAAILLAEPDGNVRLYSATAGTFVSSRKDFSALQGAIAASSYDTYVVGNNILNKALVPTGALDSSVGASSGFAFVNQGGFRTTGLLAAGAGAIQNLADLKSSASKPTRMVEAPLLPGTGMAFTRTVAPLATGSSVAALTTSGITVLSWSYDAPVAPPAIGAVVNAADGKQPVAPGGLISIYGQQMSPVNLATKQIPLPTALGESCVTVNGSPVPLLFVSNQQINAQLPFNVSGAATLAIRTPGGTSDNYYFVVNPAAPSIFRSGTAGPLTGLATVVRWDNGELVTPTNPVHPNDTVIIYLTGMGPTTPEVETGMPAPTSPLAYAAIPPVVTLGGRTLDLLYAGLAPGEVGVYQINATVPYGVPLGVSVPLVIDQGGATTQLDVRVVK